MEKENKVLYTPTEKRGYNFEMVDIFLRVKGRLPNKKCDSLTQEILDDYFKKYENKELEEGMVSLSFMYNLIKSGKIVAVNN